MDNTGAAECFDCPERYYCDGTDPEGFVECTLGRYCETGTDVPTNCPAGERKTSWVSSQDFQTFPRPQFPAQKTRRRSLDPASKTRSALNRIVCSSFPNPELQF